MRHDGLGGASFPPQVMVPLLVYASCTGVRSSRQIERPCQRDVALRVIAANQVPDHTTIARFRGEHDEAGCERLAARQSDARRDREGSAQDSGGGGRSGFVHSYNGQAVVDEGQVIVAVAAEPERIGTVLADAGCCSDENLAALPAGTTEYLVNTIGEKDRCAA